MAFYLERVWLRALTLEPGYLGSDPSSTLYPLPWTKFLLLFVPGVLICEAGIT